MSENAVLDRAAEAQDQPRQDDATPQDEALAPFGGRGQSGLGAGGDANLEELTERRWLTVTPGAAHYPY